LKEAFASFFLLIFKLSFDLFQQQQQKEDEQSPRIIDETI